MARKTVAVYEAFATVRTAFGCFVVRLTMPSNFRLGVEHLAAPAYVILLAWPNIEMVTFAMLDEVRLTAEATQTDFALQTGFGAVHGHVLNEIGSAGETFRAVFAQVVLDV